MTKAVIHKLAILIMISALTACMNLTTVRDNLDESIMNKSIQHAIDIIGIPSEERTIVGRRNVIWRTGSDRFGNAACTLTVSIDKDDIVRNFEFEGIRGACYSWLSSVR